MKRTTHELIQGSEQWLAFRASVDGSASEASAMLGISSYKSRDDLIREKATGIRPEVDARTQERFNEGHRLEELARGIAERFIGEDLYPATYSIEIDGLVLSASCDGLTIDDECGWEHKSSNAALRESLARGVIPDEYHPQLEQVALCTGASKVLFTASNGTEESALHVWYMLNPELRARIIAGWKQLKIDVANYIAPEPSAPKAIAEPVAALPSINYQIDFSKGISIQSNLENFKKAALQLVENSKVILVTDQDFENAKGRIKACESAEANIKGLVERVLGELGDVNTFKSDLESIGEFIRQSRINQDKQVKNRSAERKAEIIAGGKKAAAEHIAEINSKLGSVTMPAVPVDFDAAVFRKSSFDSMQSGVNDALAAFKIEANSIASKIDDNLNLLRKIASNHAFLFSDRQQLVLKDKDAVEAIAKQRIAEHDAAEQKRIDDAAQKLADEKIAAEKAAEVKRVADEKAAEEKRITDEKKAVETKAVEPEYFEAPEFEEVGSNTAAPNPIQQLIGEHVAEAEREIPISVIGRGRPGDDMIINYLADAYSTDAKTVIGWLKAMNLDAAEKRLAA
jgi:predicted phage-related endonuclease